MMLSFHFLDSAPLFSLLHVNLLKLNGQTDLVSNRSCSITINTNTEDCQLGHTKQPRFNFSLVGSRPGANLRRPD